MQTFLVHMREPRRLFRELGPCGFVTFLLVVGGNWVGPLAHPIFAIWNFLEVPGFFVSGFWNLA